MKPTFQNLHRKKASNHRKPARISRIHCEHKRAVFLAPLLRGYLVSRANLVLNVGDCLAHAIEIAAREEDPVIRGQFFFLEFPRLCIEVLAPVTCKETVNCWDVRSLNVPAPQKFRRCPCLPLTGTFGVKHVHRNHSASPTSLAARNACAHKPCGV
jgi:hypothetical protein